MTKTAFIGDIHGYAPALELALDLCQKENVVAIVGLGDFVDGYDADEKCVHLVKKHFDACVRGNHDEDHGRTLKTESTDWLLGLSDEVEAAGWLVTHSSPRANCPDEYIRSTIDSWNCFDDCNFDRCVVGHSHQPMLYRYAESYGFESEALDATSDGQILEGGFRYLLVNPSLAYNRSGQQNPGFSIFDSESQRLKFVYLDLPQIDRKIQR